MSDVQHLLRNFFSQFTQQNFRAGHIIIPAFSTPPGIYYVLQGKVKQYTMTPDGREFIVNIYKPGTFFPMISTMTSQPNSYFFEAIDTTQVYRAPTIETLEFLKNNSEVLFDLLYRLYTGIDGLLKLITQIMAGTVQTKVVAALIMLAKRFGEVEGSGVVVQQVFTHNEVAKLVGVSRESVTRVMSQLKKQGLLEIRKRHLYFPNVNALEQYLNQY